MLTANTYYVETLGTFRISQSGRALAFPRAKEKALLAFLATSPGRPFQRSYLANLLWPNVSEENAKHSLNNAIYTVKRLARTLLVVRSSALELNSTITSTDLQEIDHLIAAQSLATHLGLIKGEFLADLDIRHETDFEQWRSNYNRELFHHIDRAINAELDNLTGAQRAAITFQLSTMVAVSTFLPESSRQRNLKEAEIAKSLTPNIGQQSVAFSLPFVGRDEQLAKLHNCWTECRAGHSRFIKITGHPGHGKTRLVQEFMRTIRANGRVLETRCYQSERRIAFGPFVELLSDGLCASDLANIEPIWLSALHDIIPSLPVNLEAAPSLSSTATQSRLCEAVSKVIVSIAKRKPLLIFIDDVQWADDATQALISFLSHRLQAPVMMIVAERANPGGYSSPVPWTSWPDIIVGELSNRHLADAIGLLPPSIVTVAPAVNDLDRLTRGHPYMVTELIRSTLHSAHARREPMPEAGYIGVDQFLRLLLGNLPENAQNVAAALAVIGRPAPLNLVSKVSCIDDLIGALDVLYKKGLIDQERGKISLRHDLVRESMYKGLSVFKRNQLHRRAASVLAANAKNVGETAEHYYRARDRRNCFVFAMKASKDADVRYANDESIYYLRMARKAMPDQAEQIRTALAERLYRANRKHEAAAEIGHILLQPELLAPRDRVTWKLRALELAYENAAISGPSLRVELESLSAVIDPSETKSLAQILFLTVQSAFHDGQREAAETSQRALKAIAERDDSFDGIAALSNAVHAHSTVTSASQADEWAVVLRSRLSSIVNPELKIRVLAALTIVAYSIGRLTEAYDYAGTALQEINRVGAMNMWPTNAAHLQMLDVEQGRFSHAAAKYEEVKSRAGDNLGILATCCANAAMMHYVQGELERAMELAGFGLENLANRKSTWTELFLRGLSGLTALDLGDFATAAAQAEFAKNRIDSLGTRIVDISYAEILIARIDVINGRRRAAMTRLRQAINDYLDRDLICRLRMELELAKLLKPESREEAKRLAIEVYQRARASNAIVIAEAADSLLMRL
jgi:hypothetical protein